MPKRINFDELEWKDPTRGYYLSDVKQKTLWVNEETGATLALMKFPPGLVDKIHTHPKANQIVHPISGLNGGKGVGITVKGEPHGGAEVQEETILLFYWDGPPDSELVE
jgi:hypothetical protein